MSWISRLHHLLHRFGVRENVSNGQRSDDFVQLFVDRLEERRVLSVSATLILGELLIESSDGAADDIRIEIGKDDTSGDEIIQIFDSNDLLMTPVTIFDGDGMIVGDAVATSQLTAGLQVNLGDQDDTLDLQIPSGFSGAGSPLQISVNGGDGMDTVTLNDTVPSGEPLPFDANVSITSELIQFGDDDFNLGTVNLDLTGTLQLTTNQILTTDGDFTLHGSFRQILPGIGVDFSVDLGENDFDVSGDTGASADRLGAVTITADTVTTGSLFADSLTVDLADDTGTFNTTVGDLNVTNVLSAEGTFSIDGNFDAGSLTLTGETTFDAVGMSRTFELGSITGAGFELELTAFDQVDFTDNASGLGALIINSGSEISLHDVTSNGLQSYTAVSIITHSNYITNGGDFNISGVWDVQSSSMVTTSGGNIDLESATLTSSNVGISLTLDATSMMVPGGLVTLGEANGSEGNTLAELVVSGESVMFANSNAFEVGTLDVDASNTISLVHDITTMGDQSYQANRVNLAGDYLTNGGAFTIAGNMSPANVVLTGDVTVTSDAAINTATSDIDLSHSQLSASMIDLSLTLDAGSLAHVMILGADDVAGMEFLDALTVIDADEVTLGGNSFTVEGLVEIKSATTLIVTGALLSGSLNVTGLLNAQNTVETDNAGITVTGNVQSNSEIKSNAELHITGTSQLGANVTANGDLDLDNSVTLTSDVVLTGATIDVIGDIIGDGGAQHQLTLDGTSDVSGAIGGVGATLGNLVTKTGSLTVADLRITGDLTSSHAVHTDTGAVVVGGNADVEATLTAMTSLNITGDLDAASTVTATTGDITVGGNADLESTLTAGGIVDINGQVDAGGSITAQSGSITLGTMNTDRLLLTGDVTLTATDIITLAGDALSDLAGPHSLTIDATNGTTVTGTVGTAPQQINDLNVDKGSLTAGGIIIEGNLSAAATVETLNSGNINIDGNLETASTLTSDGFITVMGTSELGGDVTSVTEQAYFGAVTLTNDVKFTAADGPDLNTTAIRFGSTLNEANTASSSNATFNTNEDIIFIGEVGAGTALDSLTFTQTNDIQFNETVAVVGNLTITTANNADFKSTIEVGGNVLQSAGTGTTTFNGTAGTGVGGTLHATTTNVTFAGTQVVTAGAVTITTAGSITTTGMGGINAGAAMISLTADADGTAGVNGGEFNQSSDSTIQTDGSITLQVNGSGNASIASLIAGSSAGLVQITTGGAITDALIGEGANITSFSAALTASAGIGAAMMPGADIDTAVAQLAFFNTSTTAITQIENVGALSILETGGITESRSNAGGIIAARSPLSINMSTVVGGNMTFIAGNSTSTTTADDLTIAADVTHLDGEGFIAFIAGDDILHNSGTITNTGGSIHEVRFLADHEGVNGDGNRGGISQSAGAGIAASRTSFEAFANITLNNSTSNAIDTVAANVTGSGFTFELANTNDLIIGTVRSASSTMMTPVDVEGIMTSDGNVTINNGTAALSIGTISGGEDVTAGSGTVTLTAGGVSEQAGSIISATALDLAGTGTFILAQLNQVGTFAADVTGPLTFTDADALIIGTVNSTTGITTGNGNVTLTTGGLLTIGTSTATDINAGAGAVFVDAAGVDEQSNARILSTGLELVGTGGFDLMGANEVSELAGNITGTLTFTNDSTSLLTIGEVGGSVGLTLRNSLALNTITTAGAINFDEKLDAAGTSVFVTTEDAVDQDVEGIITAALFGVLQNNSSSTPLDVTLCEDNMVGIFAAGNMSAGGAIRFHNAADLSIGGGTATTGIETNNGDIEVTTTGMLTVNDLVDSTAMDTDTANGDILLSADGGVFINNAAVNAADISSMETGDVFINSGGTVNISGTITADTLRIVGHGTIAQNDVITVNTLGVRQAGDGSTTAGGFILLDDGNSFSNLAAFNNLDGGLISIASDQAVTIGTVSGFMSVGKTPEFIETSGVISTNGDVFLEVSGASLTIGVADEDISAGDATVTISANGVSEAVNSIITATSLNLTGTGDFTLDQQNDVDFLSAEITGALVFIDADELTIGSDVNDGINTNGNNVTLISGGALKIGVDSANESIFATGSTVTLQALSGGIQEATGTITAANLQVLGTGDDFVFNNDNSITTLAAEVNGKFTFENSQSLTVGSVTSSLLGTTSGITTDNDFIQITTLGTGSNLVIGTGIGGEGLETQGGRIILNSSAELTLNDTVDADTSTIQLRAGLAISQSTTGVMTANELSVSKNSFSSGDITLCADNIINIFSAMNDANGGAIRFHSQNNLLVDRVNLLTIVIGVNTNHGEIEISSAGSLTINSEILTNNSSSLSTAGIYLASVSDLTISAAVSASLDITDPITQTGDLFIDSAAKVIIEDSLTADTVRISADGDITQNSSGIISAHALGIRQTGGDVTLEEANNVETFAASNTSLNGSVTFTNSQALSLGTISTLPASGKAPEFTTVSGITTDTGDVTLTVSGAALTIGDLTGADDLISAAGANVFISAEGAAALTNSTITATKLNLTGTGSGDFTLAQDNNVDLLAATIDGRLTFNDVDNLTIGTVTNAGVDTSGNDATIVTSDQLIIGDGANEGITATGAKVSIDAENGVVEALGSIITARNLELLGSGAFTLSQANAVDVLAADIDGDLTFENNQALTIGSSGSTSGISTMDDDVSITTSNGGITLGDGNASEGISAGNAKVTLVSAAAVQIGDGAGQLIAAGMGTVSIDAASGVTESMDSIITTDNLELLGTGDFTLNEENEVGTLAVNINGELSFTNSQALTLGTSGSSSGITTTDDDVSITTTSGGIFIGNGSANEGISVGNADVNIVSAGEVEVGDSAGQLIAAGTGTVSINAASGATEDSNSTVTAANLELLGSGIFEFNQSNNVQTLAANVNGDFSFINDATLTVGTAGVTDGITTSGDDVRIEVTGAGHLFNIGNSNSDQNITTAGGNITLISSGLLTIGDGTNGQSLDGDSGVVLLNSAGVTEAAGSTITGAGLELVGTGTFKLAQMNNVDTLAVSIFGALTFVDSDALTVGTVDGDDGVAANGSIGITTGDISTAGGFVSITSGGELTVNEDINTSIGSGGLVEVNSAVLHASLNAGTGDITLNGGGDDLIITANQITVTAATYSARRDIIIGAELSTTGALADLSLSADSDSDGSGGVLIQDAGQLSATGEILLEGSDLFVTAGADVIDAVVIEADTASISQVTAAGLVTIQSLAATNVDADIIIHGDVNSTNGNLVVAANRDALINAAVATTSAGNVQITADGNGNMVGGVHVTAAGFISSSGSVQLRGSDVHATSLNVDSVRIDSDGINDQVLAAGSVTIHSGGDAPLDADLILDGNLHSIAGDVDFTSERNILLSSNVTADGGAVDFNSSLVLTGSSVITAGTTATFASTIDDDGSGGTNSDLDVTAAGTTRFNAAIGSTGAIDSLTLNGGGTTEVEGDVSTVNNITVDDALILTESVTIASLNGSVLFNSTVDSQVNENNTLTVSAANQILFANDVGLAMNGTLGGITLDDATDLDFNQDVSISGNIDIDTGAAGTVNFNGTVTTTNNGNVEITNAGELTLADAAVFNLDGSFTQDGNGNVSTGAEITTTADFVTFASAVTLTDDISIDTDTALGDITFFDDVSGVFALTLAAGIGSVTLSTIGATTAVTGLTISSSTNTTLNSDIKTAENGNVALTHSGLLSIDNTATLTLGGSFTEDGGGTVSTGADITTTGDAVTFNSAVTLTESLSIDSTGGMITFASTLNGTTDFAEDLTLNSDTGDILFTGTVGSTTDLGDISITLAKNVTVSDTLNANTLSQTDGTGTTLLDEAVTLNGADGLLLMTSMITINSTIDTLAAGNGGTVTIINSGQLTLANAASFTLDGQFIQSGGGSVSTGANISTTGDDVTFANDVKLTDDVVIDTGAGVGDITFSDTIAASSVRGEGLTLIAGTGNILFAEAVGTTELKDLTITSAMNVTASQSIAAGVITQTNGSGTTAFNASVTTTQSGGINLTGNNFTIGDLTGVDNVTTTGNGNVSISNSGLLDIAANADFAIDGAFLQDGGGTVETAGDITTTGRSITFTDAVTLTDSGTVTLDTTDAGNIPTGAEISFLSTLEGEADCDESLTLNAGTMGNITFTGEVGTGEPLGDVLIENANNVTIMQSFVANTLKQKAGSGTTTIDGTVTTKALSGVDLTTNVIDINAILDVTANANASIILNSAGNTTVDGELLGDDGDISINAGDSVAINGLVDTDLGPISFAAVNNVTFTGATLIASESGDITVTADSGNLSNGGFITMADGATADAGTGEIEFTADGNITLGELITESTNDTAVVLTTAASVRSADAGLVNVTANSGQLNIQTATGVDIIRTQVASLDVVNSASGAIIIHEEDAIDVVQIDQQSPVGATDQIELTTVNGSITVVAGGNGVSTAAASNITLDASGVNSDLNISALVTTAGGKVLLNADRDIFFEVDGNVTSTHGSITITADADMTTGGAITQDDGLTIDAGSGEVRIQAENDITLANVVTTNAGADALFIQSDAGALLDGGEADVDLIANTGGAVTTIRTATGVGTTANPLETSLVTLDLVNSTSGEIQMSETDALTIRNLQQNGAGLTDIRSEGTLTANNGMDTGNAIVSFGSGTIHLEATGDAAHVQIDDGISSTIGNLELIASGAGGDVNVNGDVTTTGGNVTITAANAVSTTAGDDITTTGQSDFDSGNVNVTATAGAINVVGDIVTTSNGIGDAGNIEIQANGTADITAIGDLFAMGVNNTNGGDVTLQTTNGSFLLTNVDVTAGADAGNIQAIAGSTGANADITLMGAITATGTNSDGTVIFNAASEIIDGNDGSTLISTGDLSLSAGTNIGEIDDFVARTGNAIDAEVSGLLQDLSIDAAGGVIHLKINGDLHAATGAIVPDTDGAATLLVQTTGALDVGTNPGVLDLSTGDLIGLHAGTVLTLPNAGMSVGTGATGGTLRLSGGTDIVDPAGRELGKLSAQNLFFTSDSAGGATTINVDVTNLDVDLSGSPSGTSLTINNDGDMNVDSIDTNGGDLLINNGNALNITSVVTNDAEVRINNSLASGGGDLSLELINAGTGNVILDTTANGGQLRDLNGAGTNIIAAGLAIRTANISGVDIVDETLEVQIDTLAASADNLGVKIFDQTGSLTIGTVDGLDGTTVTNAGADDIIEVVTVGELNIDQIVSSTGLADIFLAAQGNKDEIADINNPNNVNLDATISKNGTAGQIQVIAGNDITLTSKSEITAANDSNVILQAGVDINGPDSTGTFINGNTEADILMSDGALISTETGALTLNAANDVAISILDAGSGNVEITADNSGLGGTSTNQIGEIRETLSQSAATGEAANIIADDASLSAATGIGSTDDIELDVNTVDATNSTSGNLQLFEIVGSGDNDLTVNFISNMQGNVDVQTGDGNLMIAGPVSTTDTTTTEGTVRIIAGDADGNGNGDLLIHALITTEDGSVTLSSDGNNVGFNDDGDVSTDSGRVDVSAGISGSDPLLRGGNITQTAGSVINAGDDEVTLTANGQITLGQITTTNSSDQAVTLNADAGIDSADPGNLLNIDAASGRLVITTVTGVEPILTTVESLDLMNMSSGGVTITETNALDVIKLDQNATTTSFPAGIDLTSGGTLTLIAGEAGVTGTDSPVNLTTTGAGSEVVINSTVQSTTGKITINAAADVRMGGASTIETNASELLLVAGDALNGSSTTDGSIVMTDGAKIMTNNASIDLIADQQIVVGKITTTTDVRVTSFESSISDAGDTDGVDISATNLGLDAAMGIGSGNALETSVSLLAASNGESDSIQVDNTRVQLLTIKTFDQSPESGGLGAIVGVTNRGVDAGQIEITNLGAINVDDSVTNSAGGDIMLTATANGGNDDHLIVNAQVSTAGAGGNVSLNGGTDILVNARVAAQADDLGTTPGGLAGDITFVAERNIIIDAQVDAQASDADQGGDIKLTATSGNIDINAQVNTHSSSTLEGGNITFDAGQAITIDAQVNASALTQVDPVVPANRTSVPIPNPNTSGNIQFTAGTDITITDTGETFDIDGNTITGTAAGTVTFGSNVIARSATGSIVAPTPSLSNVVTPQVTATGIAVIEGDFGRELENTFVYEISWQTGVSDTFSSGQVVTYVTPGMSSVNAPGNAAGSFIYDHMYFGNPDPLNPAAPIPITLTLFDDPNITFLAAGTELGVVSVTSFAEVPGEGLAGAAVFDVSIEVPPLEAPRTVFTDALETEANDHGDDAITEVFEGTSDSEVSRDELILIIQKLGPDGKIEKDQFGRPIQRTLYGADAIELLTDLPELHERLDFGHWKIFTKEGEEGQMMLVEDVLLRDGKPVVGEEGTQDRPPTSENNEQPVPKEQAIPVEQETTTSQLQEQLPVLDDLKTIEVTAQTDTKLGLLALLPVSSISMRRLIKKSGKVKHLAGILIGFLRSLTLQ